jgi:hypothetical protein
VLLGRRTECEILDGLIDGVRGGGSIALVLRGEAGVELRDGLGHETGLVAQTSTPGGTTARRGTGRFAATSRVARPGLEPGTPRFSGTGSGWVEGSGLQALRRPMAWAGCRWFPAVCRGFRPRARRWWPKPRRAGPRGSPGGRSLGRRPGLRADRCRWRRGRRRPWLVPARRDSRPWDRERSPCGSSGPGDGRCGLRTLRR